MTINLTPRLRAAASYLEAHGWVKGVEKDDDGRVCLTGAVRFCQPQTGDEYLIREVLRKRDRAEGWNDTAAASADEVAGYLRTAEITDTDLEGTFGPQWREIVTLVRQAATLTPEQAEALDAAWDTAGAAWCTGAFAWAAKDAARDAAGDAWAAGNAAGDAAWAIATRHLIGTHGYTREHHDLLIGPWVSVMGEPEAATS